MSLSLLNSVNITLDSYCAVICLIILISLFKVKGGKLRTSGYFLAAVVANIVVSISDIFTLICEGPAQHWYFIALPVSMFIYYAGNFTLLFTFILFLCDLLTLDFGGRKVNLFLWVLYGICGVLMLITPFTGFLYTIDAQNHYSRGENFWVSFIIELCVYILFIMLILVNGKKCGKRVVSLFLTFAFIPQAMQIVQMLFYGVSLVNTGWTISMLIMFLAINDNLEEQLAQKNKEIEENNTRLIKIQDRTITGLSNLVENRDTDTGEHVRRTSDYVELLARTCMEDGIYRKLLTPQYIEILKKAAPMHDIGKIVVSDVVLKKPGRLDEEEFKQIKRHASEGGRIILEVFDDAENWEYISTTLEIATGHHEKWNGTGYPKGLRGSAIPVSARIMAIADVFDALVSPRVYKKALSYDEAFTIIQQEAGTHFDPVLVREFMKVKDKVIEINEKYKIIEEQITSIGELESEELDAI